MANNNLATVPEFWVREGLMILTEETPMLMSVNRQYSEQLTNFGETVNCYRARTRKTRRMTDADDYEEADATTDPVPVVMNQRYFDSFIIKDGERTKSNADLIRTHLRPALETISRGIDRALIGHVHKFLSQGNPRFRAGKLGGMTAANSASYILEAQEVLHTRKAPQGLKTAVVHQTAQTFLQGNELFVSAEKRGSNDPLITGRVGTVYNTEVMMSQNVPYTYGPSAETEAGTVATGAGQAAGYASTITLTDDFAHTLVVGEYFVLGDNGQPTYITATNGDTTVVLNEALKYAVAALSVATVYFAVTNEAVERAAGYQKLMRFTHGSGKYLQVGQLISFGTTTRHTYTIIETTEVDATHTDVLLDRPLDITVGSGASAYPGPAGAFNAMFHRDALAFVSRPLALPPEGSGANAAFAEYKGVGLRAVMQYDSKKGGTRVNLDVFAGIAQLDENLMCPLLS